MPDQSSAASEHALMQEITAPLQTLPDDPLALVEAEFPTAMRGYERHAVDDYVEQVSRLVAELHATRSPEAAVRRALERVGDQISGILQRAHETAAQITTQSRAEAEERMQQARRESATMIDAAAQRVRELDADADRIWAERQRIVGDAEDLSAQLLAVARDAMARFPADEPRAAPALTAGDVEASADESVAWSDEAVTSEVQRDGAEIEDGPYEEALGDERLGDEPLGDEEAIDLAGEADVEGPEDIEATRRFQPPPEPPLITDEDSTQIIPPSSDAAQHRHDS